MTSKELHCERGYLGRARVLLYIRGRRARDEVSETLADQPQAYRPIFMVDDDGSIVARDWAVGFMLGIGLRSVSGARSPETGRSSCPPLPFKMCGQNNPGTSARDAAILAISVGQLRERQCIARLWLRSDYLTNRVAERGCGGSRRRVLDGGPKDFGRACRRRGHGFWTRTRRIPEGNPRLNARRPSADGNVFSPATSDYNAAFTRSFR
jgi:hypothetical protein